MDQATKDLNNITASLQDPEIYRQGEKIPELLRTHAEAKKRVETLTTEWEGLAQELEELERTQGAQTVASAP